MERKESNQTNKISRQTGKGDFNLLTFPEHAHNKAFLKSTCLTGLPPAFRYFTICVCGAWVIYITWNEEKKHEEIESENFLMLSQSVKLFFFQRKYSQTGM